MVRRKSSLVEAIVGLSLALVLVTTLVPGHAPERDEVRARLEDEVARLILEGELARARAQALEGRLVEGRGALSPATWPSAVRLRAVSLSREVSPPDPQRSGLRRVKVRAVWSATSSRHAERRELELEGLLPRSERS